LKPKKKAHTREEEQLENKNDSMGKYLNARNNSIFSGRKDIETIFKDEKW
jgi:hypothetical protein